LWDDFTQEEIREGSQEKAMDGADDKNVALVGKSNEKKKDMSKVRCFACHKTVHYASQCPNKKKKKSNQRCQHQQRLQSLLRDMRGSSLS
jgi:hypothetical protein